MSQEKDVVKVLGVPFPVQQKTGLLDAFKSNPVSEQKLRARDIGIPSSEYDFASSVRDVLASIPDFENPEGMVIDAIERTLNSRGHKVEDRQEEHIFKPARLDPRSQNAFLNTQHSMGEIKFVRIETTESNLLENPSTQSVTGQELATITNNVTLTPASADQSEVIMRRLYRIGAAQSIQLEEGNFPAIEASSAQFMSFATDLVENQNTPVQNESQPPVQLVEPPQTEQIQSQGNVSQFPSNASPFLSSAPFQIVRSDLDQKKAA